MVYMRIILKHLSNNYDGRGIIGISLVTEIETDQDNCAKSLANTKAQTHCSSYCLTLGLCGSIAIYPEPEDRSNPSFCRIHFS